MTSQRSSLDCLESSATSVARSDPRHPDFRGQTLHKNNNVLFEVYGTPTPAPASQLIDLLAHWPESASRDIEQSVEPCVPPLDLSAPIEEGTELQAATDLARQLPTLEVALSEQVNQAKWLNDINAVILGPLKYAARAHIKLLSSSQADMWNQGHSWADSLTNPKPDLAFGLAISDEQSSPLSSKILAALEASSSVRLTYTPVAEDYLIFPSVIHEAKSSKNAIFWAENQLAVGAARALALLGELSTLSGVAFQHCVILIATQGAMWKFFVAYQDEDIHKRLVSILAPERKLLDSVH